MAQRNAAISRAIAVITTVGFLPFPAYQPTAPLLYSQGNERRILSDRQGIRAMRAIVAGGGNPRINDAALLLVLRSAA